MATTCLLDSELLIGKSLLFDTGKKAFAKLAEL